MNDPTPPPELEVPWLSIAAVERDTRLSKDTLRIWERRYGFPLPARDAHGERLYPPEQVQQLRHIRRLMDAGHRPGRIVGLALAELEQLGARSLPSNEGRMAVVPDEGAALRADLLALVRQHDAAALRRSLGQALLRQGLHRFIGEVAVPLLGEIGSAWAAGQLQVFEEHLCSEALEAVLHSAIAAAPPPSTGRDQPRVLLSTFPGESHGLALLMAEALFCVEGCRCLSLGVQTPLQDLRLAAQAQASQIVALSFSSAAPLQQALDALAELRAALPPQVEIWAGSRSAALQRRSVPGVLLLERLEHIPAELQRWQKQQVLR
ncbi:MAG: hypothetical protein RJA44_2213 [Pseudomonadota bacterium]